MFKFFIKMFFLLSLTLTGYAQAGIIDNTNLTQVELDARDFTNAEDFLTEDLLNINFITYNGWDFVWASPVNVEEYKTTITNTLYAPSAQKNWGFAENHQVALSILMNDLSVLDFYDSINERYIQGAKFFNSYYEDINSGDFDSRRSQLTLADDPYRGFTEQSETFFVRNVNDRPSAINVPEPSTIMIFAIALIALSLRKRAIK